MRSTGKIEEEREKKGERVSVCACVMSSTASVHTITTSEQAAADRTTSRSSREHNMQTLSSSSMSSLEQDGEIRNPSSPPCTRAQALPDAQSHFQKMESVSLEEFYLLQQSNASLSIRVAELEAAAEMDELEMEKAMKEMEQVVEEMHGKLMDAERNIEMERKEFGKRLQMLALESADQELLRREMMENSNDNTNRNVIEDSSEKVFDGVDDPAILRERITELEAEIRSLRVSRQSSLNNDCKQFDSGTANSTDEIGVPPESAVDSNNLPPQSGTDSSHGCTVSRSTTPTSAELRVILDRTVNEFKARRAERSRVATERAIARLAMQSSSGDHYYYYSSKNSGNNTKTKETSFSDLTVSAALNALSPEKKMIHPDDAVVVEMMEKQRRRGMSSGDSNMPMRKWEDQSVEVIRMELTRRGISCKLLSQQGVMNDKQKLLQLLYNN